MENLLPTPGQSGVSFFFQHLMYSFKTYKTEVFLVRDLVLLGP